jgi:glycosyltransferase involved in cell wall biosynthesis
VLVQAMASLPECAHLVIVGDGPEFEPLRTKAAALGLANRLHFLGRRDDVEEILPAFDVFCLPSLVEGLPRAVLEAQACDVPVVASNVGGLSEAVCARAGALVPPGDPAALAGALQQILDEPPERGTTRRFVEREFPWSRTLGAYENLLGVRPC